MISLSEHRFVSAFVHFESNLTPQKSNNGPAIGSLKEISNSFILFFLRVIEKGCAIDVAVAYRNNLQGDTMHSGLYRLHKGRTSSLSIT